MRVPIVLTAATVVGALASAPVSGLSAAAASAAATAPQADATTSGVDPDAVLRVTSAAADWQLAHPSSHAAWDWTQAAFYTGVMALAEVSPDPKYLAAMRAMGEENQWRPGLRPGHADDYAVVSTYARLYAADRDRRLLAPALALFNFLLSRPYDEPLAWGNAIETREWAWCDALFMAPPALAAVSSATGDRRYLELANGLWWKTTEYLYDRGERLYYRDSRFFEQREPNGRKVFWSRGNGWVFAGLARMLQEMPADHPDRGRYVTLFREMANAVKATQGEDGYWRSSLLDPMRLPNPETSGTGFFVYSLAWGINRGLLEEAAYGVAVRRGWEALVRAVHPDGRLGFVQKIGYEPGATAPDTTEVYGVGALLLAGSEIYKLELLRGSRAVALSAANPLDEARFGETLEVPWKALAARIAAKPEDPLVVVDDRSGAVLPTQVFDADGDGTPDALLFQSAFFAKERKAFQVRALARPWRSPVRSRAYGRFVPERKDDFAWENDRVAFRMYGPALQAGGEISSGIDVWAKGVRRLVIDDWYKGDDYHRDHGEGLDFYKVGPSRGCGGLGLLDGATLHVSKNYKKWRLFANGPIRVAFALSYDAWGPAGMRVAEEKTLWLDAGQSLSRIETRFRGPAARALPLAVGIATRPPANGVSGEALRDEKNRWLGYWEPPQGDSGQIGCGVVLGSEAKLVETGDHLLLASSHSPGKPFVYWAGATWSKGLDFRAAAEWQAYLRHAERRASAPIQVEVAAR